LANYRAQLLSLPGENGADLRFCVAFPKPPNPAQGKARLNRLRAKLYKKGIILEKIQSFLTSFQPGAEITEYISIPDNEIPPMINGF
jgi:hypothetical protein